MLCQHVFLCSLKNQKGPLELEISLTLTMTAEPEACCEEANYRERFSCRFGLFIYCKIALWRPVH